MTIFFDTETCGFHGPIVLLQYAEDYGPVELYSPWKMPVYETMELIEHLCEEGVIAFNLSFDWFHICQMYTVLELIENKNKPPDIEEYAVKEPKGRFGSCLKPAHCFDIMLHARKGPYQSTMDRDDVVIRRVPAALSYELARELDIRIKLKDLYFARKKDPSVHWQVVDIDDEYGEPNENFKNIILKFSPSSALKALAEDALKIDKRSILLFGDAEVEPKMFPHEAGYAPFARALGDIGKWNKTWPAVIHRHISHWGYNAIARQYASDDVVYLQKLYDHFGHPPMDDDDSILAAMVGAVRWRGYKVNIEAITKLRDEAKARAEAPQYNFNSVAVCRKYLEQVMSETETMVLRVDGKITTKAPVLEEIAKWSEATVCEACNGQGCHNCEDGLVSKGAPHPAAVRAREILDVRHAQKEVELYEKLLKAGRFHASFVVIGTRSTRMAGGDDLNAQGIKRAKHVRSCFPLADGGLVLCGGDFEGFEVVLMDAAYGDPKLHSDLVTGKKIHGLWGTHFFPGKTYEEICESKGAEESWQDYYTRSKNGVFAICYFGEEHTLITRVGISSEAATAAFQGILKEYPTFAKKRKEAVDKFCSMRQPNGIGTTVEWHEPAEHIESMFGFRRYFTLENQICQALFNLAEKPPDAWQKLKIKVVRRDRMQTVCGAVRSALFAAAFQIQASNMRAAGNHIIQSSGGYLTKALQRRIWELQPAGIYAWRVQPMNIHDEIMCPTTPECIEPLTAIQNQFIADHREKVPLIAIDWSNRIETWADK